MSPAFADPAKYDLYDCKQLEPERKTLAARTAELQGLMAKAETGVAGPVVAEMAYRNDYIAVRGQSKLAEEAWRRNRCQEAKPEARPGVAAASRQGQSSAAGASAFAVVSGAMRALARRSPARAVYCATRLHARQS